MANPGDPTSHLFLDQTEARRLPQPPLSEGLHPPSVLFHTASIPNGRAKLERRDRRKLLDVGNTLVRRMTGLRRAT